MLDYRVYRLTPDGHVGGPAQIINCADDTEAIAHARAQSTDEDVEIWQRDRRVAMLRHGDRQP